MRTSDDRTVSLAAAGKRLRRSVLADASASSSQTATSDDASAALPVPFTRLQLSHYLRAPQLLQPVDTQTTETEAPKPFSKGGDDPMQPGPSGDFAAALTALRVADFFGERVRRCSNG